MICWYCHWGWSKQVADIHDKYVEVAGESAMLYGPAHIVWEDENFEREHVQWCLDLYKPENSENTMNTGRSFREYYEQYTDKELEAVRQSLDELLQLPDEALSPKPVEYDEDEEHPENYPPPQGIVMVKK